MRTEKFAATETQGHKGIRIGKLQVSFVTHNQSNKKIELSILIFFIFSFLCDLVTLWPKVF